MCGYVFPPGRYYVGDLCYVMHHRWEEICAVWFDRSPAGKKIEDGHWQFNDGMVLFEHSTGADGLYVDTNGHEYPVDAALIGCIHEKWLDPNDVEQRANGQMIEMDEPFFCEGTEKGISIGNKIRILLDVCEECNDEDCEPCSTCGEQQCGHCDDCGCECTC